MELLTEKKEMALSIYTKKTKKVVSILAQVCLDLSLIIGSRILL